MRIAVIAVVVTGLAAPAGAEFVMCIGGSGFAPNPATVLPPHPRVVYYMDQTLSRGVKMTAKIDGTDVKVKLTTVTSPPFVMTIAEIDSDRTGTLTLELGKSAVGTWTIKRTPMPKDVPGFATRYQGPSHAGEPGEEFDGLAIKLPAGTPAILGHVHLGRDPKAIAFDITVPMYTAATDARPMIRVGQFACAGNMPLDLMKNGFDLDVEVTLADGTKREVTGLADHMTLPAPLPAQPRPKNARDR